MRKLIPVFAALILGFGIGTSQAEIRSHEVTYSQNGTTLKGYIAYDDKIKGKRPGVLVVHEWWGHNDYARKRARMLAEMGYLALAVDMYGDGKTANHPDDAKKFMMAVTGNMDTLKARFDAGLKYLRGSRIVEPDNIAALGYCFGGAVVLNMARAGTDLKGVVSYHGSLGTATPAEPGKVKARVAVFTGADDPMIPADQVAAFKAEMDKAGVNYKVTVYPGAKHSFTNPDADKYGQQFNMPLAYDAAADKDSWAQTDAFLKEVFGRK
ncbi:dienelactone hydrolase [Sulfuritortus calidifontis]|uniref:Dienelactone hydrolase n=1 Tax=Sulfuritortus calidifontis TaxID=1914471 RepID=A0A4R3JXJ7_9PROT|nr:dienelactone hydrolase family protein [Sulfuritortus calidifontis]TCS71733.1 dienelactone hydrolase [Sulfuritortus calidifontis]